MAGYGSGASSAANRVEEWLRSVFSTADVNKDGKLCFSELHNLVQQNHALRDQFKEATGRDYGAFWATLNISKQTKLPLSVAVRTFRRKAVEFEAHDWVREVFSMADRNNDGNLSHTELKKLFKAEPELRETFRNIAGRAWSDFWVEIDENNDGRISLDEMRHYFAERAAEKEALHAARELPATARTSSDLDFVSIPTDGHALDTAEEHSGTIDGKVLEQDSSSSSSSKSTLSSSKASQYLSNKGLGWLMELEDEDEDDQKPLLEELDIDLKDIYYKVRCVLLPIPQLGYQSKVVRDNPDFWGPLLVVMIYALVSLYGQFRVVSWILTIWFFGSLIIYLLARVLGANVSFAQALGVIGYSVLPLVVVAALLPFVQSVYIVAMLLKVFGVLWATFSAGSLLATEELAHKKSLLLYPIWLLFVYLFSLYTGA